MGLVRSIAAVFSRFSNSRSHSINPAAAARPEGRSEPNAAHALGRLGEDLAASQLKRSRDKILYRNFRAPGGGEIDIVCRDRDTGELVFVEVKTRRSRDFADPAAAVTRSKQELIARGADSWLRLLDRDDIR